MDINEIKAFVGKLVTLQLKTPWIALMYQARKKNEEGEDGYACNLAVSEVGGKLEPYGPQQFLANVKLEVRTTQKHVVEGVQDTISYIEYLVVIQRGADGSTMEVGLAADEISFITRIVEPPALLEKVPAGRIIAP